MGDVDARVHIFTASALVTKRVTSPGTAFEGGLRSCSTPRHVSLIVLFYAVKCIYYRNYYTIPILLMEFLKFLYHRLHAIIEVASSSGAASVKARLDRSETISSPGAASVKPRLDDRGETASYPTHRPCIQRQKRCRIHSSLSLAYMHL